MTGPAAGTAAGVENDGSCPRRSRVRAKPRFACTVPSEAPGPCGRRPDRRWENHGAVLGFLRQAIYSNNLNMYFLSLRLVVVCSFGGVVFVRRLASSAAASRSACRTRGRVRRGRQGGRETRTRGGPGGGAVIFTRSGRAGD